MASPKPGVTPSLEGQDAWERFMNWQRIIRLVTGTQSWVAFPGSYKPSWLNGMLEEKNKGVGTPVSVTFADDRKGGTKIRWIEPRPDDAEAAKKLATAATLPYVDEATNLVLEKPSLLLDVEWDVERLPRVAGRQPISTTLRGLGSGATQ